MAGETERERERETERVLQERERRKKETLFRLYATFTLCSLAQQLPQAKVRKEEQRRKKESKGKLVHVLLASVVIFDLSC